MEEVLPIFHEIDLLQEQISLLTAEALLRKHRSRSLLELVIGSLDLLDVYLLLLVHLNEPVVHDLLLLRRHGPQRVEEVSGPHDLRVHDHRVYQVVGLGDELGASERRSSSG